MTELDTHELEEDSRPQLEDLDIDSDEELREALASGLLKPGLNRVTEVKKKKPPVNNVSGLKQKLSELQGGKALPWIERLDMMNAPAPLAPELALQEENHAKQREKIQKLTKKGGATVQDLSQDPVHNDFKREMLFYRQAQSAVLEAIPRLKSMNIPTKRPSDYYAQMAKTDAHMNKIREKLVSQGSAAERLEKIRKLRDLRKYGKQVQVQVEQKRQKEKREMLEQVKKFRKGQTDSIDFLDDNKKKPNKNSLKKETK